MYMHVYVKHLKQYQKFTYNVKVEDEVQYISWVPKK